MVFRGCGWQAAFLAARSRFQDSCRAWRAVLHPHAVGPLNPGMRRTVCLSASKHAPSIAFPTLSVPALWVLAHIAYGKE